MLNENIHATLRDKQIKMQMIYFLSFMSKDVKQTLDV